MQQRLTIRLQITDVYAHFVQTTKLSIPVADSVLIAMRPCRHVLDLSLGALNNNNNNNMRSILFERITDHIV